jgi:hypothetical protein
MTKTNTKRIAELNDLCRRAMGIAAEQWALPVARCRRKEYPRCRLPSNPPFGRRSRIFDSFTPDNDPYGEHDFGAFEHEGQRIFWKIDYYAPDMEHGSEDPADPKQTVRVLTIMLASEY